MSNVSVSVEYQKMILKKVSFNEELFQKELLKAKKWFDESQIKELLDWALVQFESFASLIRDLFNDFF